MTTTPAAVEALKLAEEAIRQLIACHDEGTCPAIDVANAALAALAHQSPPTGVSGSQAKSEAVAPWGWAVVNKNGDEVGTRARLIHYFGVTNYELPPINADDLAAADREAAGWAPHRIVTLYAAPQEAVERQPLTEIGSVELNRSNPYRHSKSARSIWLNGFRAAERKHGIGPATQEKP